VLLAFTCDGIKVVWNVVEVPITARVFCFAIAVLDAPLVNFQRVGFMSAEFSRMAGMTCRGEQSGMPVTRNTASRNVRVGQIFPLFAAS
jgi:hypothetical protein